ncbi:MerR family transcriptional regulator [Streptomyces sp. ME19-01-6]|uniref:MerR family transcriptional regulator n=1 Tax=Streptomyces sp. ME19-01-6 TaxID=3028686 RepID=UPI0029A2FFEE|nr:MerR family transcriptional regulator [Streptomyces sp. ME19-01-6]MDX3229086.1 MerR family transcriptional regulator [Streptomyces sp. ME19-01-6]
MFTIGEFAKHGRVSVRMLRHYDAIGLLRPVHTDPTSGYRFYEAGQLARLNRVIALKDLGFSLQQVKALLDDHIGTEELRGMLRLRRAELESAVAEAAARLAQVEARLRTIENEGRMPTEDIVIKSLPPLRLAELTATAASFEPQDIGPVIGPLFGQLCGLVDAAGVTPTGPGLAYYEDAPEGGGAITVHAALPVAADVGADHGFQIVHLPGVERAATIVHRGPMEGEILATSQALARWIDTNGYRSTGYPREISLDCPEDRTKWVTELQDPIVDAR